MGDSDDFWAGCSRGELVIQACADCGRYQHFPRARCHFCMSDRLDSRVSTGNGTLLTYSTVYRAPSPEFAPLVPYTLGVVRLDLEQVQMMARILGEEEEFTLDMPVTVDFWQSPLGPIMPAFSPVSG